jgi:ribosomal protein S18 acetylase RimI-like enzyme
VHGNGRSVIPTIRRAILTDAPALAALAAHTFEQTFGADNTPEDLALHLATAYGVDQQSREIQDVSIITLVAEHEKELVAFSQLRLGGAPACVTGPAPIEIQRFYLSGEWHGRGLAQQLMDASFAAAREAGAQTVWLGVWERNPRAIAFYRKLGYRDVGAHVFVVGTDPQTDRILTRPLDTALPAA